jgi:uncharacterized protein YkwD
MMHLRLSPLIAATALLGGCLPEFTTVDLACDDSTPGGGSAPEESAAVVTRMNCYRRFVGMSAGRVDDKFSDASEAHAEYALTNGVDASGTEDPSLPGFTGENTWDRLLAFGYEITDETFEEGNHFWTVTLPSVGTPTEEVDSWMNHYLTRQVILQPAWQDAGWGRAGSGETGYTVFENLAPYPADERVGQPIMYPKDGQVGVPVAMVESFSGGPIPANAIVGYPITITVGSDDDSGDWTDANPYGLTLLDAQILDEGGFLVEAYEIQPESTPYPLPYTIAMVPVEPLEPEATYQVFAKVSWSGGIREVTGSFTTSADPAPTTARSPAIHTGVARFERR